MWLDHYGVKFPDGLVFDPWKEHIDSGDLTEREANILNDALQKPQGRIGP
jgi:hypothetical protein